MSLTSTFNQLSPLERRRMMARSERLKYAKGEVIIKEGRQYNAIHLIDVGWVRVEYQESRSGAFDSIVVLARLGPGAIFGDMSFLEHSRACASVYAETPVEVLYIDGAEVDEMILGDPSLAGRFYLSLAINLAHRLRTTTRRVRTD